MDSVKKAQSGVEERLSKLEKRGGEKEADVGDIEKRVCASAVAQVSRALKPRMDKIKVRPRGGNGREWTGPR